MQGIPFARALKDVAVRDQVSKFSADLPQQLRGILDGTPLGHLTPPETTAEGVQMFAVCAKKETKTETPGMREIRDQMFQQTFGVKAKRYLEDLRRAAMIENTRCLKIRSPNRSDIVQPLALTLGEPAGIGPDLVLAVWCRRAELNIPAFYIVADADFLRRRADRLGLVVPIATVTPAAAAATFAAALPVVTMGVAASAEPGRPDQSSAPAAIASIRRAVSDVLAGSAAAVVTSPVAKNVLYHSGFAEPGHTEFLATQVQEATGKTLRPVMMLWSPELAVVPVTIHLPLRQIFEQLSTGLVVETGRIVARDLAARFRIARPRLVVAGLNPHAGEDGAFGEEDRTIVAPAVARLQRRRHRCAGSAAGGFAVP